ncbi:hypothetical protein ABH917_004765 [Thermobifida halotolerans]
MGATSPVLRPPCSDCSSGGGKNQRVVAGRPGSPVLSSGWRGTGKRAWKDAPEPTTTVHRSTEKRQGPRLEPSPHARGARLLDRSPRASRGTIPAYAGSTTRWVGCARCRRDHPRMRGEHTVTSGFGPYPAGPSPHTRGALDRAVLDRDDRGTIPAYAGSTSRICLTSGSEWDHPRIRGEHALLHGGLPELGGPSPHTRGARVDRAAAPLPGGTIPAYAGSTLNDLGLYQGHGPVSFTSRKSDITPARWGSREAPDVRRPRTGPGPEAFHPSPPVVGWNTPPSPEPPMSAATRNSASTAGCRSPWAATCGPHWRPSRHWVTTTGRRERIALTAASERARTAPASALSLTPADLCRRLPVADRCASDRPRHHHTNQSDLLHTLGYPMWCRMAR